MRQVDALDFGDGVLRIPERYAENLDIATFACVLDKMTFSYKLYWLDALLHFVGRGAERATFAQMAERMVCSAWYTVLECHLHLSGPVLGECRDNLELIIKKLAHLSGLGSKASDQEILDAMWVLDKHVQSEKLMLVNKVPYAFLTPFLRKAGQPVPKKNITRLPFICNVHENIVKLPYTMTGTGFDDLGITVHFDPAWSQMIRENMVSIRRWLRFETVQWLQARNPDVPDLAGELSRPDPVARRLVNAHQLWSMVVGLSPVEDVFTGKPIHKDTFHLDHFIPWSFVMHDELWNLSPLDPALNISKGSKLPPWEPFFERFAANQRLLCGLVHSNEEVEDLFWKCRQDNLNSVWALDDLYTHAMGSEGFTKVLEQNMFPVWEAARRQGYPIWFDAPGAVWPAPRGR